MISISVVMPTYNTPVPFLKEAVDSILDQTFQDFELIIIDDGSTDASCQYLEQLIDPRIRIIRNEANIGITKSLNIGLRAAKGKYIARMDSDDVSFPKRFEKQFAFMEKHPDVLLCGTNIEYFGSYSATTHHRIKDMEWYRISTVFSNPGPSHPTAFLNHELLLRYNIFYDEELIYAQDYGLWVEISKRGRVCLLEEPLVRRRMYAGQVSSAHREKQIQCDRIVRNKLLVTLLGDVSKEESDLHYRYGSGNYQDAVINDVMLCWYHRLIEANDRTGIYNKRKFRRYVYDVIMKSAIYRSFKQDTTYFSRISMFFRYLPFFIAVKASAGMSGRSFMYRLQRIRDKHE